MSSEADQSRPAGTGAQFAAPASGATAPAAPVLRPAEIRDGPAIHELLVANLPDILENRDRWLSRWRWQYWDNPFREGRPAGWVLADGERVLGHLGAVYLPITVGGATVTGAVGADYAVADEAVARGGMFIALELTQRLFAACHGCLVMATTANEKTGAVFGRFGARPIAWTKAFWRAPANFEQQIRTFHGGRNRMIRGVMDSLLGPLLTRGAGLAHRLAGHGPGIPIPRGCWLETTVPQLAKDLGHFWAGLAEQSSPGMAARRFALDRSQAFFDWRYARHPERDHVRVLVVRMSDGTPLGAAIVFREQRQDRHIVYVEDMLVAPQRTDVVKTLLCAALRLACQHGAKFVITSPGSRTVRSVLWELGFQERARNAPAAVVCTTPVGSQAALVDGEIDDHFEFWHGMMF